jgi:predicted ATPase/class 3 adenylate cyclase
MTSSCPSCGEAVGPEDRFCSNCGTPLATPTGAERKLATIVFVDLVGSTELAAGADPETIRARLAPFFDLARSSLEEHGGTLEKYIGDAVLAVFGVPIAHGDDPDRAVAAALALVERLAKRDSGLSVRIGIETGEVLSTGGEADLSITGEAVNAAARLQQGAAPGEILVGARAARACRRARLEPQAAIEAKGLSSPLAAWRAVATSVAEPPDSDLPLLGREDDLALLRLVHRRAVRERAPQLVAITGEAGIGKTRIANELMNELRSEPDPPRILVGRNPPYGRGIAFWALGEILRGAAGVGADEPADAVRTGLRRLLSDLGADDADKVTDALMVALGGSNGADEADAEDALKRAWRRLVALLADDRPLVVAVDDAHWADEGLLDLLEEVAFGLQEAPLVVLCTSRPELYERRPDFGRSARNITQVELRPLQASAATQLARLLLPERAGELAARVAEASGGNPFFAEEVARSISDDQVAALVGRLPDTVQGAIAARMDLLPLHEKRALQYSAVLGHHFSEGALADLIGEPPREALDGLERKALVQELIAAGAGHYAFRHQLIRDVAYGALPRDERARLHERAAAQIRAGAGQRFVELAEIVAFHLAQAAELEPTPERALAAHEAGLEAARIAARRGALARSQELYEHAAGLATDELERAEALRFAAEMAIHRWRGDQGLTLLRDAAQIAERADATGLAAAHYGRAVELATRMMGVTGEVPEQLLLEMLDRGRQLVPDDHLATRAQLLLDEVWMGWGFNRPTEALAATAAEALELARRTDDIRLVSSALDANAAFEWFAHRYESSLRHTRERTELLRAAPRSAALEIERSDASHMIIETLLQTGDFEAAAGWAKEAREADLSHGVAYSAWSRGLYPTFFLGRWDETLEMAIKFREAWLAEERPPIAALASALATAGAIHGYRGNEREAAEWFGVAEGIAQHRGQRGGVHLLQADAAAHHGRYETAAEYVSDPEGGFWWNTVYLATRAEVLVLAGRFDATAAVEEAERHVGEQPYARAITLRARGQHTAHRELIERARAIFAELGCPYQEARTSWLLGGAERDRAAETFERLGALVPAEVAA